MVRSNPIAQVNVGFIIDLYSRNVFVMSDFLNEKVM